MKEEKTKSKRKLVSYLVLAVCVLLLVAATVLTVYFVTAEPDSVLEVPPVTDPDDPAKDDPAGPADPDEPSGGETVRFIKPVESDAYKVEFNTIYANDVLGWIYRHKAIDFAAEEGADVRAMSDGTVVQIATRRETGKFIVVDHGDGVKAVYRFVEIPDSLRVGASVKQGEVIGTVAAAYGIEHDEGPHLHLEMKDDKKFLDPLDYIGAVLGEK